MYIEDIAALYEEEELKFHIDEEEQRIDFKMRTVASPDVQFTVLIVNDTTVMFKTRLPMNIPEQNRDAVSCYLSRANYGLLLGGFQMDYDDGELSYVISGCHEENESLSDYVILRYTYLGFNMFDDYIPGVFAIIYGGKNPGEAYENVSREIKERRMRLSQELEDDED